MARPQHHFLGSNVDITPPWHQGRAGWPGRTWREVGAHLHLEEHISLNYIGRVWPQQKGTVPHWGRTAKVLLKMV